MDILDKAIIFATEKHSGDCRKGTQIPYIVHSIETCAIASTLTEDKEILAAAVLHDIVEDTDVSQENLTTLFGKRISDLVCADSEDKRENLPACDTWEIRKQETLDYIKKASKDEQIIILSDKLSNIRSINRDYIELGDKLWERFNQKNKKKHGWYYCGIRDRLKILSETDAYKEYVILTKKIFGE